jgi:hypothetical protein
VVAKNGSRECKWNTTVIASGVVPGSTEPQSIAAPVTLEEQQGYFLWINTSNASGKIDTATWFSTPGGPGTGQPWIESLSLESQTAHEVTVEATYDLEASSGLYVITLQGPNDKRIKKKLTSASGTIVTHFKLKPGPHRYTVYFALASTGEKVRETNVTFHT